MLSNSLRSRSNNQVQQRNMPTTTTRIATATNGSLLRGGGQKPLYMQSNHASYFTNQPLWTSSKIFLATNILGYAINVVFPKCHFHVDLLGTGAFAVAAIVPSFTNNPRIQWSAGCVVAWSVKLASFLLFRILQTGHDARLAENLVDPVNAAGFWTTSALWGIICSLPHTLGSTSPAALASIPFWTGVTLFGIGWIIESVADYQKWQFKQQYSGEFCNVGLWKLSQHPNWFGNILLWIGIFVMNAPALIEPAAGTAGSSTARKATIKSLGSLLWRWRRVGLALAGPIFMWMLFDAQATGKILNETWEANRAKYRYGTNPQFTEYMDETPVLIPNLWRLFHRGRSSSS